MKKSLKGWTKKIEKVRTGQRLNKRKLSKNWKTVLLVLKLTKEVSEKIGQQIEALDQTMMILNINNKQKIHILDYITNTRSKN